MSGRLLAAATLMLVGAGCATSVYMGRALKPEDETYIRRANPYCDLEVTVSPRGAPEPGQILRVEPTETVVELRDREVLVANGVVNEIRVRHRVVPALEGLGYGAAAGATVGLLAALGGCSNVRLAGPVIA